MGARGAADAAGLGRTGPAASMASRLAIALMMWACSGSVLAIVSDFSDLWWNASESGWGMQLVGAPSALRASGEQGALGSGPSRSLGGDVTFATLYVYDVKERPTFYSATLAADAGAWTGTLYETTGPYFAASGFDPAKVTVRAVGTMTFAPVNSDTATVSYSVDGTNVTKNVTRQTLRVENFSGVYPVATQRQSTHCPDAATNGERIALESASVVHAGSAFVMDWTMAERTCRFTGLYMQAGRLGSAQTSYSCSDGEGGDMALFELAMRNGFLTGRFQGHSVTNGCDYRGRIAGFVAE